MIAEARTYKWDQRELLNKYMAELERMGNVRNKSNVDCAVAPVQMHKPNSRAKYRITVDLKPVNFIKK